ncbi:MAG: hypothetical protein C0628_07985 [Sulfurimonas sp.]|nr:MAG: hypothetical protein C0628_07985 [Sulfurimonas sp.]
MKLIELSANKESFKTVTFNKSGLSFIVAKQKNPESSDNSKTYNGVGKSLIVLLIHFCFGAKKDHYKSFIDKLPDWVFYLTVEIEGTRHVISRKMSEPTKIYFDDEDPMTVDNFYEKIRQMVFSFPADIQNLTFRNTLPFFIRPLKKSYVEADNPSNFFTDYQKLMVNAFLMGLDTNLVQEKYKLRKEQERVEELEKNIKNDDLLKEFFTQDKDVNLKIIDLEDEIDKLRESREKYEVAEDYYDVKIEADTIEKELAKKHNEIVLLDNQIENITKSLKTSPDLGRDSIEKVYEEVKVVFPENVSKTLHDLESFYAKLTSNRIQKLSEQKQLISKRLEENLEKEVELKKELDNKMKYLGAHQALDVVIKVSDRLKDLEAQKEKLQNYEELIGNYHKKSLEIKESFIKYAQKTEEYLEEIKPVIKEKQEFFRKLAKRFYPNNASGITVYNNEGENQQRYAIEAKIESDNSDGINNVKIFCYDMTMLFKGHGHNVKFSFHDSRLFDGIDEKHKAEIFKVVNELFSATEFQYIATVNQNQLNEVKSILTEQEYKEIIEQNTILTLTDEDDSEKLLGVKVDVGYE